MVTTRGTVINVHSHGATVRLDDGTLAAVPGGELAAHRPAYVASLQKRTALDLALERSGRHAVVFLRGARGSAVSAVPVAEPVSSGDDDTEAADDDLEDGEIVRTLRLVDDVPGASDPLFEHRIAEYLKSTEAWAPADRPAPDERNQLRKKKRAAFFESRTTRRHPSA